MKTMNLETFTNELCEELSRACPDYGFTLQEITKNNDHKLLGIAIHKGDQNICPVIYTNDYFERYVAGSISMFELTSDLSAHIESYFDTNLSASNVESMLTSFDKCSEKLFVSLCSKEKNLDISEQYVHGEFLDLFVVPRVLIYKDSGHIGSVRLTKKIVESWGVDIEFIIRYAVKNTRYLFKYMILPIESVLADLVSQLETPIDIPDMSECTAQMFVATTTDRIGGARILLNRDILSDFADKVNNSFYILPSSTEELIFIPDIGSFVINDLCTMVREVNSTSVPPEQVLSDNIYYYDRTVGEITILK